MSDRAGFPLPDVEWEPTRGFWQAAAREELAIPRCRGCGVLAWYPRERCPHCDADRFEWDVLSGRGTLFSWARVERALFAPFAEKAPYVTGLVALEEDPRVRVVTLIVDVPSEAMRMDLPMRAVYRPLEFPGVEGSVLAPHFTVRGDG